MYTMPTSLKSSAKASCAWLGSEPPIHCACQLWESLGSPIRAGQWATRVSSSRPRHVEVAMPKVPSTHVFVVTTRSLLAAAVTRSLYTAVHGYA